MNFTWNPIVWLCLGLFAMAEVGNYQMGGELRRICELVGDQGSTAKAADKQIDTICADRMPTENYLRRLEGRQERGLANRAD